MHYESWEVGNGGGSKTIPQEFVDNFIMGLVDFDATKGQCGLDFQWEFVNWNSSSFRVEVKQSVALNATCGLSRMRLSIFYMKTWLCPTPFYYFNVTTNLCQD